MVNYSVDDLNTIYNRNLDFSGPIAGLLQSHTGGIPGPPPAKRRKVARDTTGNFGERDCQVGGHYAQNIYDFN